MKAIIGLDGSEGSWEALRQAALWLSPDHDSVVVYHAPPKVKLSGRATAANLSERARVALADSIFNEARARLPETMRARMETVLGLGDPRSEMLKSAEDFAADLIVVGARGLGPIRALVLGSVSQSLARHARQPILIARPKRDKATEPTARLLLPVDSIPPSRRVLDFLAQFHWPGKAEGRVLHVVDSIFGGELPEWLLEQTRDANEEQIAASFLEEMEANKRSKFEELKRLSAELPAPFRGHAPIVLDGYPAEQILRTAEADDIDLIVMGRIDKTGMERFLIGSTAERIAAHAPCSVLLIPHHA